MIHLNKEQVIKLGEKAAEFDSSFWLIFGASFLISMVLGTIILMIIGWIDDDILGLVPFLIFISGGIVLFGAMESFEKTEENVEAWKKDTVKPYINSLPVEKREAVYIKIDPEIERKPGAYTSENKNKRTPLTVTFKDKGLTTQTNWMDAHMELTKEEEPYVTYQYLEGSLGNGVDKGYYNLKVYLPENYKFTDIK